MRFKFLASGDVRAAGLRAQPMVLPGAYEGLYLLINGSSATGQTLSTNPVCQISAIRRGEPIQSRGFNVYQDLADLNYGDVPNTRNTQGTTRVGAIVPFGIGGIPNVLYVKDDQELQIDLQFDVNIPTIISSGVWELYGIVNPTGVERYELRVAPQDIVATASGQRINPVLLGPNVAAVMFRDPSDVASKVALNVNGQVAVDNLAFDVLVDITNFDKRVESRVEAAYVEVMDGSDPSTARNNGVQADITTGAAGTLETTLFRIAPARNGLASQQAAANARANLAATASRA